MMETVMYIIAVLTFTYNKDALQIDYMFGTKQ